MIHIDGAHGEGGGQILRTAVGLAALTCEPITITNIRAGRSNPGLRPQHLTAISLVATLCNGHTEGLSVGSKKIVFHPGKTAPGSYTFDIGTAGSIPLVFQTCILAGLDTNAPISITVTGGTDVKSAPSWEYFTQIFLAHLRKMNIPVESTLHKRGYYPKGGGQATLLLSPLQNSLLPLKPPAEYTVKSIKGVIHLTDLPDHIAKRMKHAAIKTVLSDYPSVLIRTEQDTSLSPGTGITLWTDAADILLGHNTLGEKGVPAEKIGQTAASELLKEIHSQSTVDVYAADQLLPYMAIAAIEHGKTSTFRVRTITGHAETHIWLLSQFYDISITQNKQSSYVEVSVSS